MHLMVAAGMSPMAAIMAATSVAARACGVDDEVGSLEPGKVADAVVVRGDPLADIDATGDVEAVFHRGALVSGRAVASGAISDGGMRVEERMA
jgi:imidazolonepropionase-like amidohydrolase